jgi:predicted XRE-type DNA-binding protein
VRGKAAVEKGSGNVFADIGLPNPDERLAKADLAIRITEAIRTRRLTQAKTARILKIDQRKIARLLRGQLSGFSTERLMHFLTMLGRDVEITVKAAPPSRRRGHLRVVATAVSPTASPSGPQAGSSILSSTTLRTRSPSPASSALIFRE